MRGLCSQLDAELPFLQLFEQHARRALAARHPRACRALRPLADDSSRCPQGALGAVLRELIGRLVVERPGLGVQAAVYVGTECVADEAGGVRGGTDPRPLLRSSKMPLADLSRISGHREKGASNIINIHKQYVKFHAFASSCI